MGNLEFFDFLEPKLFGGNLVLATMFDCLFEQLQSEYLQADAKGNGKLLSSNWPSIFVIFSEENLQVLKNR